MKHTLTTHEIVTELLTDNCAHWTRSGALKLANIMQDYEQDTNAEIELDIVAIRCDWSEDTAGDLLINYGREGETLAALIERMRDETEIYVIGDNDPTTYLYRIF